MKAKIIRKCTVPVPNPVEKVILELTPEQTAVVCYLSGNVNG